MKTVDKEVSPKEAAAFIKKSISLDKQSNFSACVQPIYSKEFDQYINHGQIIVVINDPSECHDLGVKNRNFHLLTMYTWDDTHHNYEKVIDIEKVLPILGDTYKKCFELIRCEQSRLNLGYDDSSNEGPSSSSEGPSTSSLIEKKERIQGQRTAKGKKISTPESKPVGNFEKDAPISSSEGDMPKEKEGMSKKDVTDRLEKLQEELVDIILKTPSMREAKSLVASSLPDSDWRKLVLHHWFHPYNTDDLSDATGFDFNFIGEVSEGRIATYHWWFQCLLDELYSHRNLGYVEQKDSRENPHYVEFKTKSAKKGGMSSFFVGMSPETYMSIGMVLHYTKKGTVPFDSYKETFEFVHHEAGKKDEYIHTLFPQHTQTSHTVLG